MANIGALVCHFTDVMSTKQPVAVETVAHCLPFAPLSSLFDIAISC